MRTFLIPAALIIVLVLLFSCQRELGDPGGTTSPTADSAWYISSIHSIDYDSVGVLIDSSEDYFTYQDNKTIYKNVDHNFLYAGSLDSFQYTYSYDENKRLTKFATDYNTNFFFDVAKTVLFTYTGSTSAQADITWGNDDIQRDYITYSNANKVISSYDTIPRSPGFHSTYTAYLGTGNRVDSTNELDVATGSPDIYVDKYLFSYDAQNNMTGFHTTYMTSSPGFSEGSDSLAIIAHETRGAEINNTFDKVLGNMRWYPPVGFNSFYTISEFFNYSPYPLLSAKRWSGSINMELTIFNPPLLFNGNFANTFDSNNLLVHQEIPGGFANKYGGRASLQFTYIKLPK